jgi:hypothetical protein
MRQYLAALLVSTGCAAAATANPVLLEFRGAGICNASAAVAVDERRVIVADDERPVLPIFDLATLRLVSTLDYGRREADVEGGTVFQGRAVWITSHGRNSEGEIRPQRQLLFASHRLEGGEAVPALGAPFTGLLAAIAAQGTKDATYARLAEAIGPAAADVDFAPKVRGFNIEGLTTTTGLVPAPAQEGLLVGMRNPLTSDGRAILFEVENAAELLDDPQASARLGRIVTLDLGGRRIRDIAYSPASRAYLIIGGPVGDESQTPSDGGPAFALFRWSGRAEDRPQTLNDFGDLAALDQFHAEAIVPLPDRDGEGRLRPGHRVLLLSDDGRRRIDGTTCERLPPAQQWFRGMVTTVE